MKRQISVCLLALAAAFSSACAWADTEVVDGITWTYTVSGDHVILSYRTVPTTTKGDITIPSTLGGKPVTSIGMDAFFRISGLTSVTIPSGVTSIGRDAFRDCSGLTTVTIPSSVTSIDTMAFYSCSKLTSVTIPSGVTSIGYSTFKGCSALASVTIPSSVTSIGESAFEGCSKLTGVTIPSGVTSIGESAFEGCSKLTSVTIPPGVTSVGVSAFSGCSGLTSVTISTGVTSIGSSAFRGCSGLTSVTIPTGVTTIGSSAFSSCSGLTSVTIPSSVMSIGSSAFYGCSGLTSVTIPAGVKSISSCAFYGCSGLTRVTIPSNVTSIGSSAFYGCSGLTSVTIPSGVKSIDWYAFNGCSGLTHVTIPSSVTSIGDFAFSGCSGLMSVTIPSGVTSIGRDAFPSRTFSTDFEFRLANGSESFGLDYLANASVLKSRIVILVIPSACRSTSLAALDQLANLKKVVFEGESLSGVDKETIIALKTRGIEVVYRLAAGVEQEGEAAYGELQDRGSWSLRITSSAMRESDESVLDVRYVAAGVTNRFTVRSLAFKDGVQSFANVIRPQSFVDGTAAKAFGDVAANEEHVISWKISDDWPVQFGRVAFKVMAPQTTELPLDLVRIPATANRGAMWFSSNAPTAEQVLDALFWHYADPACGLTLTDGRLYDGERLLADGAEPTPAGTAYVFAKRGCRVLAGEELEYVNRVARLGLVPDGASQYAVKHPAE